jgi:dTDP-glucose 4,6-dehydratase
MNLLVTGAAGFIGSQFVRSIAQQYPDARVVVLDALTYAGNPENLKELEGYSRYRFVHGSIGDVQVIEKILLSEKIDAIVNFAAESHVDRSLAGGAIIFARTNFEGTVTLLEAAKKYKVKRFLQVSTDEVYGSIEGGRFFSEESPLHPNNPYSAAKAAADLMVLTYVHSFGLDAVITRSSNNYGPRQYPEKFIPVCVSKALANKKCPVYGDGLQVRDWLHVEDNCRGILLALQRGKSGEVYNLGGRTERTNIEIVRKILSILGKPESLMEFITDRLGHDRRYAVSIIKATRELGWVPAIDFEWGLRNTVNWYQMNEDWMASSRLRMTER